MKRGSVTRGYRMNFDDEEEEEKETGRKRGKQQKSTKENTYVRVVS